MIVKIKCPSCETTYEVSEEIASSGADVQCAKCADIFTATPIVEPLIEPPLTDPDPESDPDNDIVWSEPEETNPPQEEVSAQEEMDPEPVSTEDDPFNIDDVFEEDPAPAEEEMQEAPLDPTNEELVDEDALEDLFGANDAAPPIYDEIEPKEEDEPEPVAVPEPEPEPEPVSEPQPEPPQEAAPAEPDPAPVEEEPVGEQASLMSRLNSPIAKGWMALAACVLIFFGSVITFRVSISKALPGMSDVYRVVGLPVNVRGLEFYGLSHQWVEEDGRMQLVVRGEILNITGNEVALPEIVYAMLDGHGMEFFQWTEQPGHKKLKPRARTRFRAQIPAPANRVKQLKIRFAKR